MKKNIIKTILISILGLTVLSSLGCSFPHDSVMDYSLITKTEILDIVHDSGSGNTYIKTNEGNFKFSKDDFLDDTKSYVSYKKNNNAKPIVSFIYDNSESITIKDFQVYTISSIVFEDENTQQEQAQVQNQPQSVPADASKYGITINNSIDTNTNTNVSAN